MEEKSIAMRSLARTILMIGFHWIVYIFTVRTVRDTQCGFKLFTRGAVLKVSLRSNFVVMYFFFQFHLKKYLPYTYGF